MAMNRYGLTLVRSDTGDGGWSLHAPIEVNDGALLVSGPADYVPETEREYGYWDRPTQEDYDEAVWVWDARAGRGDLPSRDVAHFVDPTGALMTFEAFVATKRFVADLRDHVGGEHLEAAKRPMPGWVYLDVLMIEQHGGSYHLVLANRTMIRDEIGELERELYEWACAEGMCGEEPEQRASAAELGVVAAIVGVVERAKVEVLEAANAELLAALVWLVDDMTDAGEGDNPVTGEAYDSVANARAVIAKARIKGDVQ